MLSCSIWFSAPSLWMGGGFESRCVGRVYGADGAQHHPHRTQDLSMIILAITWPSFYIYAHIVCLQQTVRV